MKAKIGQRTKVSIIKGHESSYVDWFIEMCKKEVSGTIIAKDEKKVYIKIDSKYDVDSCHLLGDGTLSLYEGEYTLISDDCIKGI